MEKYQNTSNARRVWPTIQRPDGTTLELDPGETVELDLPRDFEDSSLVLTKKKAARKVAKAKQVKSKEEPVPVEGAAAADTDEGTES